MKCLVCGRKLKNPRSINIGYGPICYQKLYGKTLGQGRASKAISNVIRNNCKTETLPGQIFLDTYWCNST